MAGFGDAIIRNYSFLYFKALGAGQTLMGLSLTIGMVSELVVLSLSSLLLGRIGLYKLLLLGASTQDLRLLGWSLITDPYLALSLQLLNGLTFGALWLAGVAYAKEIAPPGLSAVAQGLLSGVYFGLSSIAGALLGGLWYEHYGPLGMYWWGAIIMFVGLFIVILVGSLKIKPVAAGQPIKS